MRKGVVEVSSRFKKGVVVLLLNSLQMTSNSPSVFMDDFEVTFEFFFIQTLRINIKNSQRNQIFLSSFSVFWIKEWQVFFELFN